VFYTVPPHWCSFSMIEAGQLRKLHLTWITWTISQNPWFCDARFSCRYGPHTASTGEPWLHIHFALLAFSDFLVQAVGDAFRQSDIFYTKAFKSPRQFLWYFPEIDYGSHGKIYLIVLLYNRQCKVIFPLYIVCPYNVGNLLVVSFRSRLSYAHIQHVFLVVYS